MKSIKEIVESYDVKLWSIGEGILRGFCPLHDNKITASFTVYTETDSWFCFGESIGGDAASFVARIEGISYADAKQKVTGITDFQTEMRELLDGVGSKDNFSFNRILNFEVSKYGRDLMYRKPEVVNNVINFFKKVDLILQSPVTYDIMNKTFKEMRELDQ